MTIATHKRKHLIGTCILPPAKEHCGRRTDKRFISRALHGPGTHPSLGLGCGKASILGRSWFQRARKQKWRKARLRENKAEQETGLERQSSGSQSQSVGW